MKLIVTDLDGTLLNSKREISPENRQALLAAQDKGVEIAIATGRTYGNALALCEGVGLKPHIISNHGAFVHTKNGDRIFNVGLEQEHLRNAITWLGKNNYFYTVCTDTNSFILTGSEKILANDFKTAKNIVPGITEKWIGEITQYLCQATSERTVINDMADILDRKQTIGSILSITFDRDKLNAGRDYFERYQGLSMTVAGSSVFEMVHPSVSKGNALEKLTQYLRLSMGQVLAVGDNYNDISMLERVGISVAIGNAEEAVKKICKYISLSNDSHGVAYCIHKYAKLR